jgi:hypothetical protein
MKDRTASTISEISRGALLARGLARGNTIERTHVMSTIRADSRAPLDDRAEIERIAIKPETIARTSVKIHLNPIDDILHLVRYDSKKPTIRMKNTWVPLCSCVRSKTPILYQYDMGV